MEGDGKSITELLDVRSVSHVGDILHANVDCHDCEAGFQNMLTTGEEFKETKGVLSSRQTDEDAVVLVDKLVLSQCLVEVVPKSVGCRHRLFHENQIDGTNDKEESQNMVPMQMRTLEQDVRDDSEDCQRDAFLNDFQLYEVKRSAIAFKTYSVGRNLTAVFEKGNHPRKGDDADNRPVVADARLL